MGSSLDLTEERDPQIFNTPLELGTRSLFILGAAYPHPLNLSRLITYDYLMLHSNDVEEGPPSLHPPIPHRTTEMLVKYEILQKGLLILISKELAEITFSPTGFDYKATESGFKMIEYYTSEYAKKLNILSTWVIENFSKYKDRELQDYINANFEIWGGEFTNEALVRGINYE